MYKKNKSYLFLLSISTLYLVLNLSCSNRGDKNKILKYTVTPKDKFVIYGVNVNEIIDMKFRDIEEKLGCETKIDSEMAVVFIRKEGDLVEKSKRTESEDYIEVVYGPIKDSIVYTQYKDILPHTIEFFGWLSIDEDSDVKGSIITELAKNLSDNDTTRQIIKHIRQKFIRGNLEDIKWIEIDFNMPKFLLAKFSIGFVSYEGKISRKLIYKYIFSIKEEPYPLYP